MAEQTEERLQRAMDVIVRIQRIDNPKTIKAFEPFLRKDAALLLAAIDGPVPDWADLREMARNAGWTWTAKHGEIWVSQWANWKFHPPEGRGKVWASYHTLDGWSFALAVGPDSVELQNPTPAKVLEAARLLGLVGAS